MKITSAYDAFWFLQEHPKMRCREARLISEEEAKTIKRERGERIRIVKDEYPWNDGKTYLLLEYRLWREAISENLSIFWAKVDGRGRVNDDHTKNTNTQCWLEFGRIEQSVTDGVLHIMHYHDIELDCGAPTFDEALIKLARKVRRHYGDIKTPKWMNA